MECGVKIVAPARHFAAKLPHDRLPDGVTIDRGLPTPKLGRRNSSGIDFFLLPGKRRVAPPDRSEGCGFRRDILRNRIRTGSSFSENSTGEGCATP